MVLYRFPPPLTLHYHRYSILAMPQTSTFFCKLMCIDPVFKRTTPQFKTSQHPPDSQKIEISSARHSSLQNLALCKLPSEASPPPTSMVDSLTSYHFPILTCMPFFTVPLLTYLIILVLNLNLPEIFLSTQPQWSPSFPSPCCHFSYQSLTFNYVLSYIIVCFRHAS